MPDHEGTCLLGRVPNPVRWEGFQGRLRYANALGVGFHELADLYSYLCVVMSAHLALPMTCWHLWLYVAEAVRLFALG